MNEEATTTELYQGALAYEFFSDFADIEQVELVKPEEQKGLSARWLRILIALQALTENIFDQLSEEEQASYGQFMWTSCGGERVVSGGEVQAAFFELVEPWVSGKGIIQARCREARKAAGWQDEKNSQGEWKHTYLVDPQGRRGPRHRPGVKYGKFTLPGAEHARGKWDGKLTAGVKFTK